MKFLALGLMLLVSGCAVGSAMTADLCAGFKPFYVDEHDVLIVSDRLARQIVEHNEYGERQCGWQP